VTAETITDVKIREVIVPKLDARKVTISAGAREDQSSAATHRDVLRYGMGAAGALALAGTSLPAGAAQGPFKIALSNAYIGNEWRRQHA
jgi:hypothetical protein